MPLAPTVRKQSSISALCFNALFDHCHFLYSPFAYVDPLHCNMAYLYLELLKDSLNEYAYAAELAGLNYDLQNTVYGMYVSIHSPSSSYCIPDLTPHPPKLFLSQAWLQRYYDIHTVRLDCISQSVVWYCFYCFLSWTPPMQVKKMKMICTSLQTQTWLV